MIDDNFEKKYNERDSGRISLTAGETIVISEWYRDALGGFGPTGKDNVTGLVDLRIEPLYWPLRWWGYLRVAAHHPEIVVRIGLTLGVLGAGLGLVALIPPLLKIFEICELYQSYIVLGAALVAIIVGLWSCRRPPPIS